MGFKHQEFTQEKESITIYPKVDKRYLKLIGIYSNALEVQELKSLDLKVKYKIEGKEEEVCAIKDLAENANESGFLNIHKEIEDAQNFNIPQITIFIENEKKADFQFVLIYDIERLNVNVLKPLQLFNEHISDPLNPRILFSGPFGSGKTTFLKFFFNPSKSDYEVFHIYPVNFSVSSNDDIFKYIKTELLFQLLGRDVDFEKLSLPYAETLKNFLGESAKNVLAPFINLLPGVGRSFFEIYDSIEKLRKQYLEFHAEAQVDEKKLAEKYILDIYEKEGSVFEDNFYTQLIRQLIEQLKGKGKQIVLIIDDLDRMDPEHIFRILNVLSTHVDDYDSLGYNSGSKFGFDKTILVGDFHNLISIFKHRYGLATDYRGYFDKFFSKNIFHYNNVDALDNLISEISMKEKYRNEENEKAIIIHIILKILAKTENISLRELLNLKNIGNEEIHKVYHDEVDTYIPFIILNKVFSTPEFIKRLESAIQRYSEINVNREFYYDFFVWMLMVNIAEIRHDKNKGQYYFLIFDKKEFVFKTESSFRKIFVDKSSIEINGQAPPNPENVFTETDFIKIVIVLAKKYREKEMMLKSKYEINI